MVWVVIIVSPLFGPACVGRSRKDAVNGLADPWSSDQPLPVQRAGRCDLWL